MAALSKFGIDCSFLGIIGDDESGDKIKESLLNDGIDAAGLFIRPGSRSQTAFIAVEKLSGRRTIYWKRPDGMPLKTEEIADDFLDDADFLLLDGLMTEASAYAAKRARDNKVPVMLDAGRIRPGMIDLAAMCDYIVASEEFGRGLIGRDLVNPADHEEALLIMSRPGTKASTITLGKKGSVTLAGKDLFHAPGFNVDAADTTGAGDVFHGAYIYGLLCEWGIKDVVRFASAAAALKCRKPGGREGIPTLKEIEDFLSA